MLQLLPVVSSVCILSYLNLREVNIILTSSIENISFGNITVILSIQLPGASLIICSPLQYLCAFFYGCVHFIFSNIMCVKLFKISYLGPVIGSDHLSFACGVRAAGRRQLSRNILIGGRNCSETFSFLIGLHLITKDL